MGAPFTDEQIAERLAVIQKHNGDLIAASTELKVRRETLREWYNRLPDWKRTAPAVALSVSQPRPPEEPLAARQERRYKDDIARLKTELSRADRELNAAEDLRSAVFGLGKPIDPASHVINPSSTDPHAEVPLLFQSDEQWGEVIDLEEMGGLNRYDRHVAAARYRRLIEATIKCCLPPHSAAAPPVFYYCMGGDSISGSIHEELAETNDLSSIPAVRDYCANVRWGIETLRRELGCPIVVVRVPGNHDRTTAKPRHKKYVETSFDSVISWHLEMIFADDPNVTFLIPKENDAYFKVAGWNVLLTHGDMMGTGGGQGYIGAVAPISKGHRKLAETYLQAGKPVDCVLTGHFHVAVETEYGFGNGCLPGFSEYARLRLRAKPSPPVQWLLHFHPERGITTRRQIMVGAPGEGSLYESRVRA
jgi:predicted phosphodiesterase